MTTFHNFKNAAILLTATLPTLGCTTSNDTVQSPPDNKVKVSSRAEDIERPTPPAIPNMPGIEESLQAPIFIKGNAWNDYNGMEYVFAVSSVKYIDELASMLSKDSEAHDLLSRAKAEVLSAIKADELDTVIEHGREASQKILLLFGMLHDGNLRQEHAGKVKTIYKAINEMLRPLLDQRQEAPVFIKGNAWTDYNRIEYIFAVSSVKDIDELASVLSKDSSAYKLLSGAREEMVSAIRANELASAINHGLEASQKIKLLLQISQGRNHEGTVLSIHKSINGMLRLLLEQRLENI